MSECLQEDRMERIENAHPDLDKRLSLVERDLNGNGSFGIRKMVNILWSKHLKNKEIDGRRNIAWDKLFQLVLALLQSGLLVYLVTKGNL